MSNQEKINRNEFLKSLGVKGAALLAIYCTGSSLTSCKNESSISPTQTGELLNLDLTSTAAAALKTVGGYIRQNNVVVAKVNATDYVAVTQICSHEGRNEITFTNNQFYCTAHGAAFNTSGKGLNGNGSGGIKVFKVSITGNILTVSN
ncbi:Rieske 2Fe-2S domain-containing protein [Arcicella sp. DC2W]|uniref:Rieske 2Fe-2S domain-containing protein n=1 Tax=Arcicella gelida TaxID=2984195 RepID=A0ABU5S8J2_9BACT|nr:Rieske 2Fe-2S domain-containing protein [Arcicella sp. DC2W]MEA5404730.1 Rieske 2Fe-2S domain-containing protein [Arcicella sp. DC2W]